MPQPYSLNYSALNIITSYARIKDHRIVVNGTEVFKGPAGADLQLFVQEAYKQLALSYPKFHKMDLLCKLGMLCAEPVMKAAAHLDPAKTAIVLSNNASSLETDRQHQRSIADKEHYLPSPAVFVYTLPNIVIGELAIRYKATGENAFFVTERFDAELLASYADILLGPDATDGVVCGWVNVDGEAADALIYLVEKPADSNKNSIFKPHSSETVKHLYF